MELGPLAAPGVAIVLSIATFIFTQIRAQQIDNRAATKDAFDVLVAQNSALVADIASLRTRLDLVEKHRGACEETLIQVTAQLVALQALKATGGAAA